MKKLSMVVMAALSGCVLLGNENRPAWRDAERPIVTSHRGGRAEYDDNSATGFVKCLAAGVRGFETDVRLTKDNEIVIMHDADVRRTTTCKEKRLIQDMTLAEVTALTLKQSGDRVPSAQQVMDVFKGRRDVRVEWEMKEDVNQMGSEARGIAYCRKTHDQVAATMEPGTYIFTSFCVSTLKLMKQLYPDAPVGFITAHPLSKRWVDLAASIGCTGIAPLLKGTTQEMMDYAHEKGLAVTLWMVEDLETYERAKALGADATTSDHPMALLKAVRAQQPRK